MAALADPPQAGISRRLTFALALTAGAVIANLYYGQPLLDEIGRTYGVRSGLGLVTTATQAGFAAGLLLVLPLGDLVDRRRLVPAGVALSALVLAAAAAAPTYPLLLAALALLGLCTVVGQAIVPMAATIAADHERGRVVGAVMSGLLAGILLARVVSGLLASATSWRAVYACAAVSMLVLAALLARALPHVPPGAPERYPALLRSLVGIVREEPVIVRRGVYGGLAFAAFSAFWTSAALLLSGAGYGYDEGVIGLFGLIGIAGVLMANVAGRLADRGRARPARLLMFLLMLGSWGLLALGETRLAALIAGIVILDLAVQGAHILNQGEIYALRPEARSRVTSVYMTFYFAGGALGSLLSAVLWDTGGWPAVCVLGASAAAIALVLWATERSMP